MNKAMITGRLTKDPEVRKTQTGLSVCSFIVAVNRRKAKGQSGHTADFIECVAWKGTAEVIGKYFAKGKWIGLTGSLHSSTYKDENDKTVRVTELTVEDIEFGAKTSDGNDDSQMNDPHEETSEDTPLPFDL